MVFNLEYFWVPLAVLGLVGYIILACGRFHSNTARKYEDTYGKPNWAYHHIMPPPPQRNGTEADRAYTRFFFAEAKRAALKSAVAIVAILLLTQT